MYNQIDSNKRKTFLLIIVFIGFITTIGWFINWYFGYGPEAIGAALVFSALMSVFSYYNADKLALWSTGAKEIRKEDNPYVYRLVENLVMTAGMPMPRVHIINSPALNAFATGRNPEHASIALTTGIVNALENEELEGVIAHELSHVKNYDILVMTIVVVLVGAVSLIGNFFWNSSFLGRNRDENRGGGQLQAILMIAGIIFIILSPIIAELIKLAVSRRREYLADAAGALLTRYPEGLARALEKIANSNQPLHTASAATAHLFISNPLKSSSLSTLFSTHPPIAERIKRLRGMA